MVNGINYLQHIAIESVVSHLKGLGHAMLDNSSPDQLAIKLTKNIKIKVLIKTNTKKPTRAMDGQNWRRLKWIPFQLVNPQPNFFQVYLLILMKVSFMLSANHPWLLFARDFAKKKALPI